MLKEFKQFLFHGNAIDLAVGVVIGVAFGSVVNALVGDFLTPLIAAVIKTPNFGTLSFTLNGSTFMYGHLINAFVSFVLVAFAVFFFIVKPKNVFLSRSETSVSKECPECLSLIPNKATRCKYCTQSVV